MHSNRPEPSRSAGSFRSIVPSLVAFAFLVTGIGLCTACAVAQPSAAAADDGKAPPAETKEIAVPTLAPDALKEAPAVGSSVRLGGEPVGTLVSGGRDFYSAGPCRIDTALPAGYPPPTVPGAIEVKHYPSARRAEVSGEHSPDLATNFAFFRLFDHIQEREIAMTSPVEMDYVPDSGEEGDETAWTMSFLYRTPDMGETGAGEYVTVVDRPPVVVLSIGVRGGNGSSRVLPRLDELHAWVAKLEGWEVAGPPRGLYYNGPNVRTRDRWVEAQLPIRRVGTEGETTPAAEAPTPEAPAAPEKGAREVFLNDALPTGTRSSGASPSR